jgi:hypothetical protein
MASSQYRSEYPPNLSLSGTYRDFIENFYHISDTPDAHGEYAEQFALQARLLMPGKKEATNPNGMYYPVRSHVNIFTLS